LVSKIIKGTPVYQIFISYAREDQEFARKLTQSLSAASVEVWLDVVKIPVGAVWSEAVQEGLDASHAMLIIISPASMASKNVRDEWQYYVDQGKRLIPVLHQPAKIHFQLARIQYIDFHSANYDDSLEQLLATVGIPQTAEAKRAYEILQKGYSAWAALGKKETILLDQGTLDSIAAHLLGLELPHAWIEYTFYSLAYLSPTSSKIDYSNLAAWVQSLNPETSIEVLRSLFSHPSQRMRHGAAQLVRKLEMRAAVPLITELVTNEQEEIEIRRLMLQALHDFNTTPSVELAQTLLESGDWWMQSYALKILDIDQPAVLLIADGTTFATQLGDMANAAGYKTITMTVGLQTLMFRDMDILDEDLLKSYEMVILTRSEHFGDGDENNRFYNVLRNYVASGGLLLATAWVGWETKKNPEFRRLLPFSYAGRFEEDVNLRCKTTEHPLSKQLFEPHIAYLTAIETLTSQPDAIVLLEADNQLPIFGYRAYGSGVFYYFNNCQHSCKRPIPSPFDSSPHLQLSFERVLKWIFDHKARD
jgi:hypothetical protein